MERRVDDVGAVAGRQSGLGSQAVAVREGERPKTSGRDMAFRNVVTQGGKTRQGVAAHAPGLVACVLFVALVIPSSCWAYRPFIATDAAVADPEEVEIELGYFTMDRANGENAFTIPHVVLNYGFLKNWEAVAEFAVLHSSGGELNLIDPSLSVKGVLREGVLQDKSGVSIAVEIGPLLPSTQKDQHHFGFEGIGIASAKLGPFTFHVNAGLGVSRSTGALSGIWGVIGELPLWNGLRLVGEVDGEKPSHETQADSGLIGMIWQPWPSRNIAFDGGIRRTFTGVPAWQVTLGVTFGFSVSSSEKSNAPLSGLRQARSTDPRR